MIHLITHHRIQIIQMRVLHACYLANSYTHTHTHTRSFSVKVALFLVLIFDVLGLVKENLSWNWSRFYFYVLDGLYVIQLSVKVLKKNSKDRPAGPILFWPTNWFLGAGIWNCLQSDTSTYVIHIRSVICCIKTKVHTIRFYITVLITGLAQKTTELDFTYWCLNISVTVLKVSTDSRSVESH